MQNLAPSPPISTTSATSVSRSPRPGAGRERIPLLPARAAERSEQPSHLEATRPRVDVSIVARAWRATIGLSSATMRPVPAWSATHAHVVGDHIMQFASNPQPLLRDRPIGKLELGLLEQSVLRSNSAV